MINCHKIDFLLFLTINSATTEARELNGTSKMPLATEYSMSVKLLTEHHLEFLSLTGGCTPGRIAQSVTCLATDACLTADQGVASSIPVRLHTFVEIDHEMISTVILLLPLIHSRRVVVSYKRKYVHELLVNRLFKPAQEKVWLGELTVPQ